MARRKRSIAGEDTKSLTIIMRSGIYSKLEALAGPSGSKVEMIERAIAYAFKKHVKRISNRIPESTLIQ